MQTITATDHNFSPSVIRLSSQGGAVQVANAGHKPRRIVSDTPGSFDSGVVLPNTTPVVMSLGGLSQCVYNYHDANDTHIKDQILIGP
jgi:hypothetical protein